MQLILETLLYVCQRLDFHLAHGTGNAVSGCLFGLVCEFPQGQFLCPWGLFNDNPILPSYLCVPLFLNWIGKWFWIVFKPDVIPVLYCKAMQEWMKRVMAFCRLCGPTCCTLAWSRSPSLATRSVKVGLWFGSPCQQSNMAWYLGKVQGITSHVSQFIREIC